MFSMDSTVLETTIYISEAICSRVYFFFFDRVAQDAFFT